MNCVSHGYPKSIRVPIELAKLAEPPPKPMVGERRKKENIRRRFWTLGTIRAESLREVGRSIEKGEEKH